MNDIEYIDSQKKCVDNDEFFKISYDHQLEKRKLAVIKSLKWVVLNLGETQNNTFENAIKLYTQAAIEVMESQTYLKHRDNTCPMFNTCSSLGYISEECSIKCYVETSHHSKKLAIQSRLLDAYRNLYDDLGDDVSDVVIEQLEEDLNEVSK